MLSSFLNIRMVSTVLGVVSHGQGSDTYYWFNKADVHGVLVEVGMAWAVPVDIFPCLDGVEMKFCWGDADDWSVFIMEEFSFEGNSAFQESSDTRDWRDCV
jgi:hypothetical protein